MTFERTRLVRLARFAVATAVLAALLIPTTADAASAAEPGETVTLPVRDALASSRCSDVPITVTTAR
ncbi:hypothetical protein [Streptomyces glomeratus]|uniref:hypothetical protein n=1 Tax=Streptomyces glomeratus TaxID=284452 RepID=UPI001F25F1BE|nr:hypothetical protein [Streptomyces glomeratus]MCF1512688.1 hypothetical protein [Streptomyces glomeratus]